MNSPYNGKFRVSQQFKGTAHQGLDLVGVDSKTIHATVAGTVEIAGNNDPNGFGIYVRIKADGTGYRYYYGHMSRTLVNVGDHVTIGQAIGIEGSTGRSTGSHCHYEVRKTLDHGSYLNVSTISGIPNALGTYDDGYRPASVIYQVYAGGKWLPDVTNTEDYAGKFGQAITAMYVSPSEGEILYRVRLNKDNKWTWQPWVRNRDDFAGVAGYPIDLVQMQAPGKHIRYRVHLLNGGWLPWVLDCNDDNDNGYAGMGGYPIDAIQCELG